MKKVKVSIATETAQMLQNLRPKFQLYLGMERVDLSFAMQQALSFLSYFLDSTERNDSFWISDGDEFLPITIKIKPPSAPLVSGEDTHTNMLLYELGEKDYSELMQQLIRLRTLTEEPGITLEDMHKCAIVLTHFYFEQKLQDKPLYVTSEDDPNTFSLLELGGSS